MKQLNLFAQCSDVQEKTKATPKPEPVTIEKIEVLGGKIVPPQTQPFAISYARTWQPKQEKDFIKLSSEEVKERTPHGWLLKYLLGTEEYTGGRWKFWEKANMVKYSNLMEYSQNGLSSKFLETQFTDLEYPQLAFAEEKKVSNYLHSILDLFRRKGVSSYPAMTYLLDWLLYGLGHEHFTERPSVNSTAPIESELYQYFDVFPFLFYPYDYFSLIMSEIIPEKQNQKTGFFPTPFVVCELMNKLMFTEKINVELMSEPCAGCGTQILAYSNTGGLCVTTVDIQNILVKASLVNYYFYCPQYARPLWYLLDRNSVIHGNTLSLEVFKEYHSQYKENIWQELTGNKLATNKEE